MGFLDYEVTSTGGGVVIVDLDVQANVILLDEPNFMSYRSGMPFRYSGGLMRQTPVRLPVPAGHWHVVVDNQNGGGPVHANFRFIER